MFASFGSKQQSEALLWSTLLPGRKPLPLLPSDWYGLDRTERKSGLLILLWTSRINGWFLFSLSFRVRYVTSREVTPAVLSRDDDGERGTWPGRISPIIVSFVLECRVTARHRWIRFSEMYVFTICHCRFDCIVTDGWPWILARHNRRELRSTIVWQNARKCVPTKCEWGYLKSVEAIESRLCCSTEP